MSPSKESILHKVQGVSDLKKLRLDELPVLAKELREFMVETVSKTGGHLGASLGVVELTIALHYVLNAPQDKVIWDISHQTYPHKILTGRKDRMHTLRQPGGLSGFTDPEESEHDHFHVAHAGTAISQALGMVCARDFLGKKHRVVAVIGDGGLTSGLALEGINNAGHLRKKMLIVLNDNDMSISKNVGAFSRYLNKVITNPLYNRLRQEVDRSIMNFPRLRKLAKYALEGMKHLLVPGIVFEELGFRYFGPVNGHDVIALVKTLENVLKVDDLILLHVLTEKGKGYEFAEKDGERFHGVNPFDVKTGVKLAGSGNGKFTAPRRMTYTEAFGNAVVELARKDPEVVAITAAMPSGTGLSKFQEMFPDRFYDVGIAEQHAVTFAGGLSKAGLKPVCAIYSTFLQRSEDQLIHDVALQKIGLTVCMDRAGLVGADGATHNGVFDIGFIGHIPDAVIASPKDEFEMSEMLRLGVGYPGLFAMRYPKDEIPEFPVAIPKSFRIGEGEVLTEGDDISILAFGSMVYQALLAGKILLHDGCKATVANLRFAKPLDRTLLLSLAARCKVFFTVEDHVLTGGFGSKILEFFEQEGISEIHVRRIGLPDQFTEQGPREMLLDKYGLSGEKIAQRISGELKLFHREKMFH